MNRLARAGFRQFYTRFARTYDSVAALVSLGEWRAWGRAALDFLPADPAARGRVLDIAHGPGHLYVEMRRRGYDAYAFDLSPQMGRLALRRAQTSANAAMGQTHPRLARARALALPYPDGAFGCATSTFPAEFLFAPATLCEVARVLAPGGRLVIVPAAQLRTGAALAGVIGLAYRLTGQRDAPDTLMRRIAPRFTAAGFSLAIEHVRTRRADVSVWVCVKAGQAMSP